MPLSFNFGKKIKIQIFGQSHSDMLGVVIDGLPAGLEIDSDKIAKFIDRRRGGYPYTTKRAETDMPEIISGLTCGKTCGAPICAVFKNTDARSPDYETLRNIPRPSHADYVAYVKYGGANDIRGGGHFSGRLTLPLCFAGAVCIQMLEEKEVYIGAHILNIAGITDRPYDPVHVCREDFAGRSFPVNDADAGKDMVEAILASSAEGDSLGGIIECAVAGLPVGIGGPMFEGIENHVAQAVFGIPAIKGIEFGAGFAAAQMRGSRHNDQYCYENGEIRIKSNNAGGILGGISTGMPLIFRAAVKPAPSIAATQNTVNMKTRMNVKLNIEGRHDPCIVPRAVPCVEAAAAIAILDLWEHTRA